VKYSVPCKKQFVLAVDILSVVDSLINLKQTKADLEFEKINPGTTEKCVLWAFSRLFFKL